MSESATTSNAASRFYQRNFEKLSAASLADNFHDDAAIRAGTHRYSAAYSHLRDNHAQTVLEMGYGGHGIVEFLAPLTREYHLVDIVDRSGAVEFPANVHAKVANLDNPFPFPDARFDTLVAMMVIEHMFDPFHAFSEAARVTRPGATCSSTCRTSAR